MFQPTPGKPGYRDECPDCLNELTAPSAPTSGELSEQEIQKWVRRFTRDIKRLGHSPEVAEEKARKLVTDLLFGD